MDTTGYEEGAPKTLSPYPAERRNRRGYTLFEVLLVLLVLLSCS
ncbi:prepilin-type N-terminal cleavage/methylation domain-containing protein [Streptomyces sp. NPDC060275]